MWLKFNILIYSFEKIWSMFRYCLRISHSKSVEDLNTELATLWKLGICLESPPFFPSHRFIFPSSKTFHLSRPICISLTGKKECLYLYFRKIYEHSSFSVFTWILTIFNVKFTSLILSRCNLRTILNAISKPGKELRLLGFATREVNVQCCIPILDTHTHCLLG